MGLYSSYSAVSASGLILYQESQLVYELITVINFLKHKGFAQNAKRLWLRGLDQHVGKEPSAVRASHPMSDDLVAKTCRGPRRLLISMALAPDDLSPEMSLFSCVTSFVLAPVMSSLFSLQPSFAVSSCLGL